MTDVLILFLIATGAIWGFVNGLIYQIASVVGLIAGFLIARGISFELADFLFSHFPDVSETICRVMAFIIIWLLVWLICRIAGKFVVQLLTLVGLGLFDRSLGAVAGALKMIVLLSLIINMVDVLDTECRIVSTETKETSKLYHPVKNVVANYLPLIEKNLNE